jgi:hypothetical protein
MQFMDDAIWALLEKGIVSPYEAFMKPSTKTASSRSYHERKKRSPTRPVRSLATKSGFLAIL